MTEISGKKTGKEPSSRGMMVSKTRSGRKQPSLRDTLAGIGKEHTLLRATLENMAQGVAMYDADHRLVTWNERFRNYLQMPEEFLGTDKTFSDYIRYIGERGEFGDADLEAELTKRIELLETSHSFERVRPDGTVLEVRRDPVPGGGFIAIYTDITERKKAETQLREDEERFRAIDAAAPVGLIIVDKDTKILHLNKSFCEIFACDTDLVIGKPITLLFKNKEKEEELAAILKGATGKRTEFHFTRGDGVPSCAMVSTAELDFHGEKAVVASFVDISDRVRAEAELKNAKESAESASRVKSAFLANMSHELRTPLNAIIGYSEILVEEASDRNDDASVSDLKKIQSAGKHLLGLINDILDLSKIEAGRMDIYLEQVYLTKLVDEVKTIVLPMIGKNNNRLVIDCPKNIGTLRTDLTKLKQNLINLLSNAAKFTENGEVKLSLKRTSGDDGIKRIRFAVSDTGIGMSEEQLGKLFQSFTQADSSTTRNFGGTGLGLTITRHFCTMLGGTVEADSQPGQGSTFTMVLPDQTTQPAHAAPAELRVARRGAGSRALTILVVDDDPAVHEVLSATLSREGYHLQHARDGEEALEIMRKSPPDIVTLDVMMPKIDGWSVLGIMKSDPALQHIPVIMLTIVDDRNLGFSLGASEFMTKPIDRNRLIGLIQQFTHAKDAVVLVVDDDPDVRGIIRQAVEGVALNAAEASNGRAALEWLDKNPPPSLILLDLMMPEVDGFEFLERLRQRPGGLDIPVVVLTAKELNESERVFLAQRTILVLSKSAQPIGSIGHALAAIAERGAVEHAE
jgi:PAS domain S-box-containing protein